MNSQIKILLRIIFESFINHLIYFNWNNFFIFMTCLYGVGIVAMISFFLYETLCRQFFKERYEDLSDIDKIRFLKATMNKIYQKNMKK
jgi:hypothetical protein